MFTIPQTLTKFFTKRRTRATPVHRARSTRLSLEALEDRRVPAVLFQPVFGPELCAPLGGPIMKVPHVYPIFWGSYWGDHLDQASQINAQFQAIAQFGSSGVDYLSGLQQYSSSGSALIFGPTIDASTNPPPVINSGFNNPTSAEIDQAIYHEQSGLPTPGQLGFAPIYVCVTPPNVVGTGTVAGFNEPGIHEDLLKPEIREEVWVSTGVKNQDGSYSLSMDRATEVFSHELVEATSDPLGPIPGLGGIYVMPGPLFPNAGKGNQIGDNEPDGTYVYRLGGPAGPLVQAYWSLKDEQYLVPDGNTLNMNLYPSWAKGNSSYYFNGATLMINANQAGIPAPYAGNQLITIDTVAMPGGQGVQVVMDGQTFDFEPGQITKIQLNAANDTETIVVNGTLPNVPVNLNLGTGKYLVKLDPASAADPIQSGVNISTTAGGSVEVRLAPTGSLDNLGGNMQLKGSGVGSQATVKIPDGTSFTDSLTGPHDGVLQFTKATLTYSKLDLLKLGSYVGAMGTLRLTGASFNNEVDTVSGPGIGSIVLDGGTLAYSGVSEVDDAVPAQSATYVFTGTSLIGGPPPVNVVDGPRLIDYGVYDVQGGSLQQAFPYIVGTGGGVNYGPPMVPIDYANKTNLIVQAGAKNYTINVNTLVPADGLATMKIDPGKGTSAVIIAGTCVATTVTNSGGKNDVSTVTLSDVNVGVQHLIGSVNVQNPNAKLGSASFLVVDDSADNAPRTVLVSDNAITGLAPAPISYGAIAGLTINGGSGGNSFLLTSQGSAPTLTLNTGDGNDTVDVKVLPKSTFNATLNGGAGTDQLIVAGQLPSTLFQQGRGSVLATTPGFVQKSIIHYSGFETVTVTPGVKPPIVPAGLFPAGGGGGAQYGLDSFFMVLQDAITTQFGKNNVIMWFYAS